jgi:hypothetical protein
MKLTQADIAFGLKAGLITFAILVFVRACAQQIGYGFTSGVIRAADNHENGR